MDRIPVTYNVHGIRQKIKAAYEATFTQLLYHTVTQVSTPFSNKKNLVL